MDGFEAAAVVRCLDPACRCQTDPRCRDPIISAGSAARQRHPNQVEWRGKLSEGKKAG